MEVLFNVKHATVSKHISSILASGELAEISVGFPTKEQVAENLKFLNLDIIRKTHILTMKI